MSDEHVLALSERVRQLKSQRNDDCSEILRSELRGSNSFEEKAFIYDMLGKELQSLGRFDEAEAAIRDRIALQPELPEGWINLALHFHHYAAEHQKALAAIAKALEKAEQSGSFFRQAHLERIRIALELRAYSMIEESLVELVKYEPVRGSLDVRLETEFLVQIPKGAVSESVLQHYGKRVEAEINLS